MRRLYIYGGDTISQYCFIKEDQQVNRIVTKSLDGTANIQIIGNPFTTIKAHCHTDTNGVRLLKQCESDASLLCLEKGSDRIYGRIISLTPSNRVINGRTNVMMTLAKEELIL